jgi:hypothetical protein
MILIRKMIQRYKPNQSPRFESPWLYYRLNNVYLLSPRHPHPLFSFLNHNYNKVKTNSERCRYLLDPNGGGDGGDGGSTTPPPMSTTPTPTPSVITTIPDVIVTVTPTNHPDPSQNSVGCHNRGQWVTRDNLEPLVTEFCKEIVGNGNLYLPQGYFYETTNAAAFNAVQFWDWVNVVQSVEVFDGCSWTPTTNEYAKYLNVLVDSCNCDGVNYKKGGTVQNNCLKWRLYPDMAPWGLTWS